MIPKDPFMLLSFINTELRDSYPTLEEFAGAYMTDKQEITDKLEKAGYVYDSKQNRFVTKES